jgi:selenocysteine-specific elongation factor
VLDAAPPIARERKRRVAVLDSLDAADASAAARTLVAERAPRMLAAKTLGARFPMDAQALSRAAEKIADRGDIVRVAQEGWVDRSALVDLARRALTIAAEHHAAHPLERGVRLETLRQKLGARAGMEVAAEAIRLATRKSTSEDPLVVEADSARLSSFVEGAVTGGGPLGEARRALIEAGLKGLGEHGITEALKLSVKEVRAILAKLVRDGLAITVGAQWFDRSAVDLLRERVVAHFSGHEVLTIAEFKELSGLGRKQAIPLLELFDREGTSLRKGDDRIPGPKARKPPP